jgi:hypothetical protein
MNALILLTLLFAAVFGQIQQQNAPFDAVRQKLMAAMNILQNQNEEAPVIARALSTGLDAIFGGNMIVLPSKSSSYLQQQESDLYGQIGEGIKLPLDFERGPRGFNMTIANIDLFLGALNNWLTLTAPTMKEMEQTTSPLLSGRAIVLDTKDFLLYAKEILMNLARFTMKCNPNLDLAVQGDICRVFLAPDESETVLDDVFGRMGKLSESEMFKQIRSPFFFPKSFPFLFQGSYGGKSDSMIEKYQTGPLDNGQCSAIVEGFFGLRAVWRPATITLWNMPWLSASSLIGRKVFVFEWVPAQLLKTISLCHTMNPTSMRSEIVQHVATETILHRGALLYWQMF